MYDAVTLIDVIFAAIAVIFGLSSRNFPTALVAGIFIGLIHSLLAVLAAAQAKAFTATEWPYLKDAVEAAMGTGYLTFTNARYAVYIAAGGIALLLLTLAAWFVRFIVCSLTGSPAKPTTP